MEKRKKKGRRVTKREAFFRRTTAFDSNDAIKKDTHWGKLLHDGQERGDIKGGIPIKENQGRPDNERPPSNHGPHEGGEDRKRRGVLV